MSYIPGKIHTIYMSLHSQCDFRLYSMSHCLRIEQSAARISKYRLRKAFVYYRFTGKIQTRNT